MFQRKTNLKATGARRKKLQNEKMKRRRRPGERHKLEVNPRSRNADRQRVVRGARFGLKMALCSAAAFGLVAGLKAGADHLFFKNPKYVVGEITVATDGMLTRAQILEETGLAEGGFALGIDLEATRKKIESLPQVISAEVHRALPGGIDISIKERTAVAWLECEDLKLAPFRTRNGCLLGADGVAMPCPSLMRGYLRLPVIQVKAISRVKYGEVVDSEPVRGALQLIALNEKLLFEEQLEIRTIESPKPFSLLAVFASDAEVTFGLDDLERQMRDFKMVIDNAQTQGWRIATLNLSVAENVPVTFFSGAPASFGEASEAVDIQRSISGNSDPEAGRRESDARAILGTLY